MPLLEFYCPETHTIYTFYARRALGAGETPRCPDPGGRSMQRVMSTFAITRGLGDEAAEIDGLADDDPRMEAAMAQLEREMAGMDEENPDPRQLGHLMRRMAEMTGQPLDGTMEEMVRKLEEGTDPDKLEDALGDDIEGDDGSAVEPGTPEHARKRLRQWLADRRREPRRDPEWYEFDDYTD